MDQVLRSKNGAFVVPQLDLLKKVLSRGDSLIFGVFRSYIWRDELSGKCVFRLDTPYQMQFRMQYSDRYIRKSTGTQPDETWYGITCDASKVPIPGCMPKMPLMVAGHFSPKNDKGFGWPFVVSSIKEVSVWESATVQYLASGTFPGIGYEKAAVIVAVTGADIYGYFQKSGAVVTLAQQVSLSLDQVKTMRDKILKSGQEQQLFSKLGPLHVPYAVCAKAVARYGDRAYGAMMENPYKVGRRLGLSFYECDLVAKDQGMDSFSNARIQAEVKEALDQAAQEGHIYSTPEQFDRMVRKMEEKSPFVQKVGDITVAMKGINTALEITQNQSGETRFFNKYLYQAEQRILRNVERLSQTRVTSSEVPSDYILQAQTACGIPYGTQQREAQLKLLKSGGVSILLGGPGTGKTTTINGMLVEYEMMYPHKKIRLCAPTGRAAQRMAESTGREATTIHQLLEYHPYENASYDSEVTCRNAENQLDADLVVCDEASMISVELMDLLMEALKDGTSLILIGDVNQLECVGAGSVLRDLLTAPEEVIPRAVLTEVFRQKGGSLIIDNAYRINKGSLQLREGKDFRIFRSSSPEQSLEMVKTLYKKGYREDDPFALQALCPTHKGMSGIASCNKELQGILNNNGRSMQFGKTTYRVNDKIILTRNNYDPKCMYFNGDIGTVQAIGNNGIELLVRGMTLCIPKSQMMDLSLSYAMTIHKSQGSEFPYPIIILPMSASHMLTRNLLYTGVTRAKKGLIIISEGKSLEMAIQTEKSTKRRTTLGELIHERWG